MYNPERYISVEEVVANAFTIVPEATKTDRNIFRQWVYLGERDLNLPYYDQVSCKVNIDGNCFKKPWDMISMNDIDLYDETGNVIEYRFVSARSTDNLHDKYPGGIILSEDASYYYITGGSYGVTPSYAKIRYYGLPIDESGSIKIPEFHLRALMLYIKWMYSVRNNTPDREINHKDWMNERAKTKSKNKMPSEHEFKNFAKKWMSLISANVFD